MHKKEDGVNEELYQANYVHGLPGFHEYNASAYW